MKINLKSLFYGLLTLLLVTNCGDDDDATPDQSEPSCDSFANQVFLEKGGLLVIEVENTEVGEFWEVSNDIPDYTGTSYLRWGGEDFNSQPGEGLMTYKIRISTPGTYRFELRCRIAKGDNTTEHNDVWLRMADADDFYGYKIQNNGDESFVYPKGSGKTPEPNGSGKDGWFKVYINKIDEWVWGGKTSDNDGHDIYAEFNDTGDYKIELSARASGFAIDRMVLYLVSGNSAIDGDIATDDKKPASEVVCN